MTRARTDVKAIEADVVSWLKTLRPACPDGSRQDEALTNLENFAAVALRLMAHSNPSKVRSVARTTEIGMHMAAAERAAKLMTPAAVACVAVD